MIEILKTVVSLSSIIGLVLVVSYFLISSSLSDIKDLYKTSINKKYIQAFAYLILGSYIFYIFIIAFFDPNYETSINLYVISCIYFFLMLVMSKIMGNIKKNIYSNRIYCTYNNIIRISIFIVIFIVIFVSIWNIYVHVKGTNLIHMIESLNRKYSENIMLRCTSIILDILLNYICALLLISYLVGILLLSNLNKYMISSNVFEEGMVIGYIVAENEEEIMLKCDVSYPIFLKKDDIDGYIIIPNDVQVEENDDKIIFKDKYGKEIDYKGYMIKHNDMLDK